jgi:hypothetical protein
MWYIIGRYYYLPKGVRDPYAQLSVWRVLSGPHTKEDIADWAIDKVARRAVVAARGTPYRLDTAKVVQEQALPEYDIPINGRRFVQAAFDVEEGE